jgi:hypothetical protein
MIGNAEKIRKTRFLINRSVLTFVKIIESEKDLLGIAVLHDVNKDERTGCSYTTIV